LAAMAWLLSVLFSSVLSYTSFPQSYEQFAVTINTSRWDFTNTLLAKSVYKFVSGNLTFYIKAFDFLQESEVPAWHNLTTFQSNIIRCREADHWCRSISTIYDYEWQTDDTDLSRGLYWISGCRSGFRGMSTKTGKSSFERE
jgi:hypothetical protein